MTRLPGIRSNASPAPTPAPKPDPAVAEQAALDRYLDAVFCHAAAYAMHCLFTTGHLTIHERD